MKVFAIRDAFLSPNRDLGYLLYYENSREFHIELCEDLTEWEAPILLSSFVRRGIFSIGSYWSKIWAEQRVIPPDRQNLGMILKANHLKQYDVYKLLVLSDGRCAQDDCFLVPLSAAELPEELEGRLQKTLSEVVWLEKSTLLIFRDGETRQIPDSELFSRAQQRGSIRQEQLKRLMAYEEAIRAWQIIPGGHGLSAGGKEMLSFEELREMGSPAEATPDVFREYVRQNLIGTTAAAEMLHCTRQNILDMVKRGKLTPVNEEKNNYLFLKKDIQERAW